MLKEKQVFDILLKITDILGLDRLNLRNVIRFTILFSCYGATWFLMIAKLILEPEEIQLDKFIVMMAATLNIIRIACFLPMKSNILNLFSELNEHFDTEKLKINLKPAEEHFKNFSKRLIAFLTLMVLVTIGSIMSADDLTFPLYKPKSWNYSKITRIVYTVIQCGFSCYGYVVLWTLILIVIHFLIYFQEFSKFVACELKVMKTNEDMKKCVEAHLKFKQ